MSESTATPTPALTADQTAAMRAFVKCCERALLIVVLICAAAILVIILANPASTDTGPILMVLWAIVGLYPLALLAVIWLRTRLVWHLLNAHALWVGIAGALIVSTLFFTATLSPQSQRTSTTDFASSSFAILLVIVVLFLTPALRSSTRPRAERERACFADHWLKLGNLSTWRVLLFIIPHERI
jgi:hypothetical protein